MKVSSILSISLVLTGALAIPVQQKEGKSTTVKLAGEVSKRTSFLAKRKECSKNKTPSANYISPSSTVIPYNETPTPVIYQGSTPSALPSGFQIINYETSTQNKYTSNGHKHHNHGGKNRTTTTSTGNTPYQSTTTNTTPSYDDTTTTDPTYNDTTTSSGNYLTMPAGSSTGLERGASVRNVGPDGTFMSEAAIKPFLVAAHNIVRSLHEGTGSITWDSSIARLAEQNTPNCNFQHTPSAQRKGLGENISYNTNASPEDQALRQWYANEVVNYNFNNPSASSGVIGHMTAMVWKDVKTFGCAVRNCGDHGMGLYLKCNYSPTPNIIGKYDQKVGNVKGASSNSQLRTIVEKATGFTPK
ncbi:hypothetical protein H072_9036 [Dactylellina haptotyla CBS 200.50]|uniref:SCP domain-containing protein n=1 Tax=Dactylellina haptotyla (strain CBS 200.50) TaxID=1284197 RepID=S8A814_DACHA|nr:hypothetical protein H072_9036 [Dactylellina haptotyla CBS 200.50]